MGTRLRIVGAAIALLLSTNALGQTSNQRTIAPVPPRDPAATAKPGTAVISGRVVAADTRRPLRRARVTVSSAESPGPPRTANTDSDGRYEVRELPAGRFRLTVSRSGYLSLQYGQRRALEDGQFLDVGNGQVAKDVDFSLPRMGVITGHVTDDLGEPIEGVTVVAMRTRFWEGRRQLVPSGGGFARTDDTGQYRLLGLAPGTYYVRATTRETWMLNEGGASRPMGYAPTFFPRATIAAQASRVVVGVGQEVGGIDVSLAAGRAASVSGTAFDSTGKPFSTVSLQDEMRGESFASFGSVGSSSVTADGSFVIRNVPPGTYKLAASTGRDRERPEVATAFVLIDDADITDLVLVGSAGGTVTGRVFTDDGSVPSIPRLRVTIAAPRNGQPDPTVLGSFVSPGSSEVGPDGTFVVKGVFGAARVRVTLPDTWMLKAVRHEGRDITDAPIELQSGESLTGIEIVVTDRVTVVAGQLSDEKGAASATGTVLVFAADAATWGEDSRHVRAVRPDRSGRYQTKGLQAGKYLAVALEYVENGQWNDPEFLESLRQRAEVVTVQDGEISEAPLTVVPLSALQ